MPEPLAYMIGARDDGTHNLIPGTRTLECEHCKSPTLFTPSSLKRHDATFICMVCAEKVAKEISAVKIMAPTIEQLDELNAIIKANP